MCGLFGGFLAGAVIGCGCCRRDCCRWDWCGRECCRPDCCCGQRHCGHSGGCWGW